MSMVRVNAYRKSTGRTVHAHTRVKVVTYSRTSYGPPRAINARPRRRSPGY